MELATLLMLGLALGVLGLAAARRFDHTRDRNERASDPRSKYNARQSPKLMLQGLGRMKETKFEIGGELILHGRSETDQNQMGTIGDVWAPATSKLAGEQIPQEFAPWQGPTESHYELPGGYGDNRIVAMVRDPYWLFAYWEINEDKRKEIRERYGPSSWDEASQVIRIFDVTGIDFNGMNAVAYYDIGVGAFTSSWHIPVSRPNRTYMIERGLVLRSGEYVTLARSNFVTTPADQISSIIDEEWMLISELDRKLYRRLRQLPFGSSPHFAFSQLLGEEAAKLAFGLSSPQAPRTQSRQESQSVRTRSESHVESGVMSKTSFMKILTQGLLPEGSETALTGINPQKTMGLTWGGMGLQEKATFTTEYTSATVRSEMGENTLTVEPAAGGDMLRVTLQDSESSLYETMEKIRKE